MRAADVANARKQLNKTVIFFTSLPSYLADMEFLNLYGLQSVMPVNLRQILSCWKGQKIEKRRKEAWKTIQWCILWTFE